LSDTVLRLIITRQLGVAELGLFFMAARLGFLPAQLISEIIGTVAFPVYAHLQDNRQKAANIYRKLLLATSAMMIPACTVFLFLTPAIVTELLGERWQGIIVVLQFLIASTMVGVLVESIAPLMKGIGQPAKLVGMDSVQFLVLVGLGWVLVDRFGLTGAGLAWFGSILAQQFMAYFHARRLLGPPFRGVGRVFLAICLSAAVATAIAVRIVDAIAGIAGILVAVAGAIVSTFLIMAFLDQRSGLGLRQILAEPFPWAARFGKMRHVED
jgi:PST family polysaccharide transporter